MHTSLCKPKKREVMVVMADVTVALGVVLSLPAVVREHFKRVLFSNLRAIRNNSTQQR